MKRIIFFSSNRVHLARQQILLGELKKHFQVDIVEHESKYKDILDIAADYMRNFKKAIKKGADLALIRGDRYEMLIPAQLCAYRRIPIAHIEGGDISGNVIDSKIRHAITMLSDLHFATNEEAQRRIIQMGISPTRVFNFGSLDVEFAKLIKVKQYTGRPYIVVVHHPIRGEDVKEIENGLKFYQGKVVKIKSNKDEGKQYGLEEYSPEAYIRLIANAACLVGNSSSFLKEASIFGTPVVNLGRRQQNRLKPHNVLDVLEVEAGKIENAVKYQLKHIRYAPDELYWQPNTSKKITEKICEFAQ